MSRYMRVAAMTAASALLTMGGIATANATTEVPGTSAANPIVVESLTDVPEGAVQDAVSTFDTDANCETTKSWVLPGSDAVTHSEGQYLRVIPAQDAVTHQEWNIEGRSRTYSPAVEEVSHQEYKYERTVDVFKTQYQFAKYTRTKTCTADTWQNFSPDKHQGPFEGPPSWPTDPRGTWHHMNKPIPPGQAGPDGVYQNGSGNGSWFYRQAGVCSEYGPWTQWEPLAHESWQDSDAPLGEPAFHAEGTNRDGSTWYRQWQDRATGQTRQVKTGTTTETTDWLLGPPEGDGWKQVDERKVITTEAAPEVYGPWSDWTRINKSPYLTQPTPPANTSTHEYRVVGPITVTDVEPVPEYTEYYVVDAEPSRNLEDASWVTQSPGESWTLFNERVVTDTAAVAPVFYAWSDNANCEVVDAATNPDSAAGRQLPCRPVSRRPRWRRRVATPGVPVGIGMALLLAGTALVMAGRKKGLLPDRTSAPAVRTCMRPGLLLDDQQPQLAIVGGDGEPARSRSRRSRPRCGPASPSVSGRVCQRSTSSATAGSARCTDTVTAGSTLSSVPAFGPRPCTAV